jgi:cytochrome b561
MAAHAERPLHALAHACSSERMLLAFCGGFAAGAVAVGVLGLLGASWLRQILESWINIHALFGLLLCGLLFARCRWCVTHSPPMLLADVRKLSRHVSRIAYLLLYLVIGVREVIGILNSIWHGGAVDFNLFDEHFRNGPDFAGFNPKDDFQMFLASGLIALIFVRLLAFRLWLRCGETADAPANNGFGVDRPSR